jgi:hypothetical protein
MTSTTPRLSRRALLEGAGAAAAGVALGSGPFAGIAGARGSGHKPWWGHAPGPPITNPLVLQRADAQISATPAAGTT